MVYETAGRAFLSEVRPDLGSKLEQEWQLMTELAGDREALTLAMQTTQNPQVERTVNAAAHL